MSRRQRLTLLAVGLVVAVVAFVALRPGDDSPAGDAAQTTGVAPAATDPASTPEATGAAEPAVAAPKAKPKFVVIRARALKPVGGVKEVTVKKGDTVRLAVSSDRADEGHLHGYDISRPVGPGKTARYTFKAKIEGIFELELEQAGVQIASLKVEP